MSFWENIKNFFTGTISDEEFAAHELVFCPKCHVYVLKEDLVADKWVCPNCKYKFIK